MYASYRLEVSPTTYGSDGSLSINNTIQLPDDSLSLHSFKTIVMGAVEQLLPKIFEAYLSNQALKESLEQRLSEEASLFSTEPQTDSDPDQAELSLDEQEWTDRYASDFAAKAANF